MENLSDDWIALHALVTRYSRALDTRDYQMLRSVFTEKIIGLYNMQSAGVATAKLTYHTRDELADDVEFIHKPLHGIVHRNTNHAFDIDGDRASGRVYLDMFQVRLKDRDRPETVHHIGWYDDVYTKLDGQWYITERRFTSIWSEGSWLGDRPTLEAAIDA